jgi:hypothetical protein
MDAIRAFKESAGGGSGIVRRGGAMSEFTKPRQVFVLDMLAAAWPWVLAGAVVIGIAMVLWVRRPVRPTFTLSRRTPGRRRES